MSSTTFICLMLIVLLIVSLFVVFPILGIIKNKDFNESKKVYCSDENKNSDSMKWAVDNKYIKQDKFFGILISTYLITIVLVSLFSGLFSIFYIFFSLLLGTIPMLVYGIFYLILLKYDISNILMSVILSVCICVAFSFIFLTNVKSFELLLSIAIPHAVIIAVISHIRFMVWSNSERK